LTVLVRGDWESFLLLELTSGDLTKPVRCGGKNDSQMVSAVVGSAVVSEVVVACWWLLRSARKKEKEGTLEKLKINHGTNYKN
jgi:hypothetical protein